MRSPEILEIVVPLRRVGRAHRAQRRNRTGALALAIQRRNTHRRLDRLLIVVGPRVARRTHHEPRARRPQRAIVSLWRNTLRRARILDVRARRTRLQGAQIQRGRVARTLPPRKAEPRRCGHAQRLEQILRPRRRCRRARRVGSAQLNRRQRSRGFMRDNVTVLIVVFFRRPMIGHRGERLIARGAWSHSNCGRKGRTRIHGVSEPFACMLPGLCGRVGSHNAALGHICTRLPSPILWSFDKIRKLCQLGVRLRVELGRSRLDMHLVSRPNRLVLLLGHAQKLIQLPSHRGNLWRFLEILVVKHPNIPSALLFALAALLALALLLALARSAASDHNNPTVAARPNTVEIPTEHILARLGTRMHPRRGPAGRLPCRLWPRRVGEMLELLVLLELLPMKARHLRLGIRLARRKAVAEPRSAGLWAHKRRVRLICTTRRWATPPAAVSSAAARLVVIFAAAIAIRGVSRRVFRI
eukprot:comp20962_c0_seq1/m.43836 comp20962_c0_seq1/g.43836  ORF comp20962_c0_seq1/g.43836 comp20962_c0_seq1/m.43836 type:complete len:471 (+) comp20962_c0_seq1:162-1574(+)